MRRYRIVSSALQSLWLIPVLCVLLGAMLSLATLEIDRASDYTLVPASVVGGPDAALAILSTIAASMVSLAALVLTITMVVVQLAMGQFSPRIVQRILRDRPSQIAIGLFVATFVHAVLSIREVTPNGDGTGTVPGVAVITAFVLVLASIAVLVMYVHHIGQALRVSALIELVGEDTRSLIDRIYPVAASPIPVADDVIPSAESGVVTVVGHEHLIAEARRADCVLELVPAVGEFVPAGAPLFRVRGERSVVDDDRARAGIVLRLEPTLDQDPGYGIQMLVDIAERSLSDSPFQDPTTAVQAIDRLHDCLRQLARRPFPDGVHRDAEGLPRLLVRTMDWEAYVRLAFDEVRMAGSGSPQVSRRLAAALRDLEELVPADRRPPVTEQLRLLAEGVREKVDIPEDARRALAPDPEGIGAAATRDGSRS